MLHVPTELMDAPVDEYFAPVRRRVGFAVASEVVHVDAISPRWGLVSRKVDVLNRPQGLGHNIHIDV